MWFKISSFLTFLAKSTNQHGVHSPFVYNLVTKCFYKKTDYSKKNKLNICKKWLQNNTQIIEVTDFGSGSKIFKSNFRKVSKISNVAGISTKKSNQLINIIEYLNLQNILEIGTSLGLGTATIKIANTAATVTTLEGCKNTANIAKNMFTKFNLNPINIIIGDFSQTLPNTLKNNTFDLIYFDGNHQQKATLAYFNMCLNAIHNNSVFIFDDIHWSQEMLQTWEIIKQHPKVTFTINTYFWGLVFFRKEQKKQHFTIRV